MNQTSDRTKITIRRLSQNKHKAIIRNFVHFVRSLIERGQHNYIPNSTKIQNKISTKWYCYGTNGYGIKQQNSVLTRSFTTFTEYKYIRSTHEHTYLYDVHIIWSVVMNENENGKEWVICRWLVHCWPFLLLFFLSVRMCDSRLVSALLEYVYIPCTLWRPHVCMFSSVCFTWVRSLLPSLTHKHTRRPVCLTACVFFRRRRRRRRLIHTLFGYSVWTYFLVSHFVRPTHHLILAQYKSVFYAAVSFSALYRRIVLSRLLVSQFIRFMRVFWI